ncbi:MAG: LytTR family DNA-binding domain-containing protein [Bacteroidetes bacterium]|nr:LytTR family DNA-binding domain-containing protein [Bacteroidota bacterium]
MSLLKILIVDDEEAAGNVLKVLIEKHVPIPKEIMYCHSPEEALALLPRFQPGLIMLDIEMPGMNGFDFLNKAVDWQFDVIFTTAYDKYAIKAIRFSALDYLLKPVDLVDLQNAINRHIIKSGYQEKKQQQQLVSNLLTNLQQKSTEDFKLSVSVKEGVFLFDTKDIICMEGMNNYTKLFFTNQKPLLVARTLKEYEDILTEHKFLRIHKSFLVNKMHVKKLDNMGSLWLTQDITVPVSRRKKGEVTALFG